MFQASEATALAKELCAAKVYSYRLEQRINMFRQAPVRCPRHMRDLAQACQLLPLAISGYIVYPRGSGFRCEVRFVLEDKTQNTLTANASFQAAAVVAAALRARAMISQEQHRLAKVAARP